MVQIALTVFILLNFLSWVIFSWILGIPYNEFFEKTWLIFVLAPLSQGLMYPLLSRDVFWTIGTHGKAEMIQRKMEAVLIVLNYCELSRNEHEVLFHYKSMWKRMMYLPFHSQVKISRDGDDSLKIYGKRNTLDIIESKLNQDFELGDC